MGQFCCGHGGMHESNSKRWFYDTLLPATAIVTGYASTNKTRFVGIKTEERFFPGGCVLCLRTYFDAILTTVLVCSTQNLNGAAGSVGGQVRGDTECRTYPVVTEFGGRVPESKAWSVDGC